MAYIERGKVKPARSPWRLSIAMEFFWLVLNFIGNFFNTMFSLEASNSYGKKSSRQSSRPGGGWGGGPGGGGPSGGYGGGPKLGPRGIDNVQGIDHNSLPACGSCCGG